MFKPLKEVPNIPSLSLGSFVTFLIFKSRLIRFDLLFEADYKPHSHTTRVIDRAKIFNRRLEEFKKLKAAGKIIPVERKGDEEWRKVIVFVQSYRLLIHPLVPPWPGLDKQHRTLVAQLPEDARCR